MRKEEQVIKKLVIFDNAEASMPFSAVIPEDKPIDEMVLLEITRPDNGSYIMNIRTNDENEMMNPEKLFEAWMVMGHTIKSLVGSYKKELIEYMVKEYRTREQLEKELESENRA